NSSYIIAWGSNVPQTRTPDAHFFTEVRYKGTKTVAITPDFSEVAKLSDQWLAPKQGTDSALAMAMGHVILKEFHLDNPSEYFLNYCRRYTDMPMLVLLDEQADGRVVPGRMLRASDLADGLGETNNPEWKTIAFDVAGNLVAPNGSIGFRWGEKGKWNLESLAAGQETELTLSLLITHDSVADVAFPYFGG
ncbi:nitrate reductase subunit alpha, partial [Pseudomonas donghuensis]|nr:nitrate reductase subunit alpha [Pseudomonas donghuensis]